MNSGNLSICPALKNTCAPVLALSVLALFPACAKDDCRARLTLINATGLEITSGLLRIPGIHDTLIPPMKPSATGEFSFADYAEGSYWVEIILGADTLRETLGYVVPTVVFRDTLSILQDSVRKRLVLKQNTSPCSEVFWKGFRFNAFMKRAVKKLF